MKTQAGGTETMKAVEAMKGLVTENFDKVEAQVDSTVESAKEVVHEMRSEAQEVVGESLSHFQGAWERIQNKVYSQLDEHPWIVFAGVFILGYILTRPKQQRRSS